MKMRDSLQIEAREPSLLEKSLSLDPDQVFVCHPKFRFLQLEKVLRAEFGTNGL